ncbi:MAG: single-stranded DNA-binding protein [Bacilli bacterium]|jgi:single-strand DNA-binding protein|nr:single-stranded DNA-binding protein [Bacilli bacterium]
MNVVIISGKLVRDPELKRAATGKSISTFSLAVRREYRDKSTGEYDVDFIDCTAFGTSADYIAKYGRKGMFAEVSGRWQIRKYQKKDGTQASSNECVASSVSLVGAGKREDNPSDGEPSNKPDEPQGKNLEGMDVADDDLPF